MKIETADGKLHEIPEEEDGEKMTLFTPGSSYWVFDLRNTRRPRIIERRVSRVEWKDNGGGPSHYYRFKEFSNHTDEQAKEAAELSAMFDTQESCRTALKSWAAEQYKELSEWIDDIEPEDAAI